MRDLTKGDKPDDPSLVGRARAVSGILNIEDDLAFRVDLDGVVVGASKKSSLWGDETALVGVRLADLIHPDDLRRFRAKSRRRVLSGQPVEALEVRVRRADGSYDPVHAQVSPTFDDDGKVNGAIVSWRQVRALTAVGAAHAFATLAEGTRVLLRSTTEQELLQQMCDAVCLAGGYQFAWYGRPVNDEARSVEVLAVGGDDRGYVQSISVTWGDAPTGKGPTGEALRTGRTQVATNLAADPRFAPWRSAAVTRGIEASVALPVRCDDQIHGAFMVYASEPDVFDHQAVELLEYLAGDIGYGLSRLRASAGLRASEEQFRLLAENASDVVFLSGPDMRLEWVSPSVQAVTGWTPEQLLGQSIIAGYLHPDDVADLVPLIAQCDPDEAVTRRIRMLCADGSYRWMSITGKGVRNPDGTSRGRVVALHDIHGQVAAEEDLRRREEQYRLLAENAMDLIFEVTPQGAVSWVSPSIRTVLGMQPQEVIGRTAAFVLEAEDVGVIGPAVALLEKGGSPTVRARFRRADGRSLWMETTLRPVRNESGELIGRIVAARDVDEQVRAELQLRHEVAFDALTGLAKKPLGITRVQEILDSRESPGWALLCVGVRGMRAINQAFTYEAGDEVLRSVAARLVAAAGAPDRVARIAGDEFLVLLRDVVTPTDAADAAERIIRAARGSVDLPGSAQVEVATYVGIAASSSHADAEELLRDASTAMRAAAEQGPDRWTFLDRDTSARSRQELDIQNQLRQGLEGGELLAWYMPISTLQGSQVRGYEALVRWVRHDGTVVAPPAFLDVAERSHLIIDIDQLVIRQAVKTLSGAAPDLHIAVNISAPTLQTGQVDDLVIKALEGSAVDPRRLHLEVTETALFQPSAEVVATMHALSAVGIAWWVDDFGTGYSSISHLRDLPISGLKLDRSFTMEVTAQTGRAQMLASGLAGLAAGLDLHTIAEGVETAEQARVLAEQGWELGQGWLFGKPTPWGA